MIFHFKFLVIFILSVTVKYSVSSSLPLVINTWGFTDATNKAWDQILKGGSALDALESGCSKCEELQCDGTVGYGGSPDEKGETTLDAMIFDGTTMNMGAVAGMRRIKNAISVARNVLENTQHSLLVGSLATEFAIQMGYPSQNLSTSKSIDMWNNWKHNKCQPNFWTKVLPDPKESCGPYHPKMSSESNELMPKEEVFGNKNHDTIGMIVIHENGHVVAGTSSNGAKYKIPGRVGDSPLPGAGAYADTLVGAAVATGDGDVMMRFLPSFLAVEEMRRGKTPQEAAHLAISRIRNYFPNFFGAIIAVSNQGEYAASCNGMEQFTFSFANKETGRVSTNIQKC